MNTELDSLEVKVESSAKDAASGLDKLISALGTLKTATKGGSGLAPLARGLTQINTAMSKLQVSKKALSDLGTGLRGLTGIKTNLTTTANQLNKVNAALKQLDVDDGKVQQLAASLNALSGIQRPAGLVSAITALRKIPEVTKALSSAELRKFGLQVQLVSKYLQPLATQLAEVGRGFAALPSNIQRVVRSNTQLQQSNTSTASSFRLPESPVTSLIAKFSAYSYVTSRIVSFLADSVTSINAYVENVNLFQVAMGDYYDEAFAYAQLVNEKLGVDPSQWMRTQGVFQSIANGFGIAEEQAYALSKGLTELSYDLSSLYNESMESSALRLQSALAGEIEPIRRLGISITEATLKEFALSKGIDKSVESMTEQEKALLRTLKLIEGASDIGAIGDFARTLESPANALRVLNQQVTQMKRALGSVLLPALVQILPYVQAFVSLITDALSALAAFANFTIPEWDAEAWGSSAASGVSDVADAMGDAASSAESLKSATLGLDELNVLSPDSGSSADSAGADWAAGLEIPDIWDKNALAEMQSQVEEIKEQMKPVLTTVLAIGAALAGWKIASSFITGAANVGTVFSGISKIFSGIFGQTAVTSFFNWLAGALAAITIQFNAAGGGASGVLAVLKLIATAAGPVAVVLAVIASVIKVLVQRWDDIKAAVIEIFDNLGIQDKLQGLQDKLNALGEKLGWVNGFWEGLKSAIGSVMDFIGGVVITLVGTQLIATFNALISILGGVITVLGGVLDVLSGVATFVVGVFTGDMEKAGEGINLIFDGVKGIFSGLWEAVVGGVTEFVNGVLNSFSTLGGTLINEKIPEILNGIKNWWGDVVDFFTEAVPKWWSENIAPWFTCDRWMELGKSAGSG